MKKVAGRLSENAKKVLETRYLKKDEQGKAVETADEMFERVAINIAQAEKLYNKDADWEKIAEQFYAAMANLEFLPNSPTLMNAGRELQQLSACFVLDIDDSMESIFETLKSSSLIQKSGGGCGYAFSRLRAKNSRVRSTGGVASGPVSFLKVFNAATQAVKQGGCVAPETRVTTERGMRQIKELCPKKISPKTWYLYNGNTFFVSTDEGPKLCSEFYNNGTAAVKSLRTRNGYSVSATGEHRFRIIDESGNYVWKQLKDIKIGDWLVLQKDTFIDNRDYCLPEFTKKPHFNAIKVNIPVVVSKGLGEFIGAFIGDGAVTRNKGGTGRLIFSFSDQDEELKSYILKIAKDLFNLKPSVQRKKGDASRNYFFNATVLVDWLQFIGVNKPSSLTVRVPEIAFNSTREFAKGFLRGLFSTDGAVTKDGYPSLSSVSKGLIEDSQQLLLALGIPTKICKETNRKDAFGKNPIYQLRIITVDGLRRFTEEIGFIGRYKNRRLRNAMPKAWEFNDIIPNQEMLLKQLYNGPGRGCGPNRSKLGSNRRLYRDIQHYLPAVEAPRNLTRSRLEKIASKHPQLSCNQRIQWFLTNKQFYDQVINIEDGRSLTLDLSVPANNTYIANGFVSHNTRRGANMGILRVDHPDILEFISCKENDKDITNFNISIAVTEEFMQRVKSNQEYDLIDPHSKRITGRLNAREVFAKVVQMAWKNGEPGIIFIDRMNKDNPTPALGAIESTNPCVTGDTFVSTESGLMRIKDIVQKYGKGELKILTDDRVLDTLYGQFNDTAGGLMVQTKPTVSLNTISQAWRTGIKPTFKLTTKSGYELIATADHRVMTTQGWVQIKNLKIAQHKILIQPESGRFNKDDRLPFNIPNEYKGIGRTHKLNLPNRWTKELGQVLGLSFGKEDREFLKKLGVKEVEANDKEVPESIFTAPEEAVVGFLQGLFSADGAVRDNPKSNSSWVALTSKSKKLLQGVQLLLLNLGIRGNIRSYTSDSILYELGIFEASCQRFREKINFLNGYRKDRLEGIRFKGVKEEKFVDEISSIENAGMKEVFDLTEPFTHSMIVNGMVTHQCGEQPLLPLESCNLGSINLSQMVVGGKVDWDKLSRTTEIAVRFLDNVIDMNKYPLSKIEEMTKGNRKVGLGVMGFADMLIKLNIAYNSEQAISLARKIMSFILEKATEASCALAKERDVFPNFEKSIYNVNGGMRLRNATLTTIAPTGTLSIIANCSSGIEPIFAVSYLRKVLDKKGLPELHPLFEEIAKQRDFYSVELMKMISQGKSIQEIEEVPEDVRKIFVTSHDITPDWHIRMQAAYQAFTHNAVSKTCNFSQNATVEDVEKVYKMADELGCKGVTIYRDKSRQEQVLNLGEQKQLQKPKQAVVISPRPRPAVVTGTTTKITTGCGNLYITINEDEQGSPFEMFMQMGKAGGCAASQLEAISRLVSLTLRSGVDLKSIIDQLRAIRCPSPSWSKEGRIFSCADAIARVIEGRLSKKKKVVKEPDQLTQDVSKASEEKEDNLPSQAIELKVMNIVGVCPDCGSALRHEEGCIKCAACGYSRC